jgi:hypothetical protein
VCTEITASSAAPLRVVGSLEAVDLDSPGWGQHPGVLATAVRAEPRKTNPNRPFWHRE